VLLNFISLTTQSLCPLLSLILVKSIQHKITILKKQITAFSTFTMLYNYLSLSSSKTFPSPKGNPTTMKHLFSISYSPGPESHLSAFYLYALLWIFHINEMIQCVTSELSIVYNLLK
jgi:hypothetical protein